MTGTKASAIVVGAGPAGLATAIALHQRDVDVTVIDRRQPPIDKPCGEGLMPDGVAALDDLGVELPPDALRPFRGISYIEGDRRAEGTFPTLEGRQLTGAGVRRTTLHAAMVRRAEQLGIDLRWHYRAGGLTEDGVVAAGVVTEQGELKADWLIGADGLRSKVRQWAGLEGSATKWQRFGVRRHYRIEPWSERVEVYWTDDCEAYVTPVAPDEVGVAFLWSGQKANLDQLLARFPALSERLEGAPVTSTDRGCGPLRQRVSAVARGRVLLVGDAAGYLDAITGEGLSLAFHQAASAAEAIANESTASDVVSNYARCHRAIGRLPNTLTRLVLALERRPRLRRRTIAALAAKPEIFDRFLAVHCRAAPAAHAAVGLPELLFRMGTS